MTPNRMFNPRTGRWTQPDPHWDIRTNSIFGDSPTMRGDRLVPSVHAILQSGNLYMFTIHNPVNFTDPSGLFVVPIHALFNPIAKAAKKLVAKLTNKPAVQNTAQQASQAVQQTQQVTQAARTGVPAAQQAAAPITRYAPQAAQQVAPRVQQAAPTVQQAAPRVQQVAQAVQQTVMSPAEAARIVTNAPRVSTAAQKTDVFHRAGSYLTQSQLARGVTSIPHSGDGIARTMLKVPGEVNGLQGVFEFLIEQCGAVSHQLFRPLYF